MRLIDNPDYRAALNGPLSNVQIGYQWGVSETTVRRHKKNAPGVSVPTTDAPTAPPSARMDLGPEGGEFTGIESAQPLTDWSHVFERFKLDPAEFEILDDTVRVSTWQQSKRLKNGDRDIVDLYSYRARFRRKGMPAFSKLDVEELIREARMWRVAGSPAPLPGVPVAAVLNLADMQLFKREGGGSRATIQRLQTALHRFRDHVQEVRARGINLNELVIVNNGDPFEGIAGNYANQAHTVEGGLRAQMNAVLDVWMMFARELYPMFEKRQFVSVLCNHTQFGRQGGAKDAITGEEDNGSAFLAETLQRILHAAPGFEDVRFTIPNDQMTVYTTAAGVPMGFNHGHKIPKSDPSGFEAWLNGQVRADRQAYEVRVWITAHRHNMQMFDIGNASVLQCPSCDGGSKWLTDTTGKHSNAGVVSILVGDHHRLGWSDLQFL